MYAEEQAGIMCSDYHLDFSLMPPSDFIRRFHIEGEVRIASEGVGASEEVVPEAGNEVGNDEDGGSEDSDDSGEDEDRSVSSD